MLKEFIQFILDRAYDPTPILANGGPEVVIVPEGFKVEQLPGYVEPVLPYISATVALSDPESFCNYVTAFNQLKPAIFSNVEKRTVTAVLDYHENAESADRGKHKAIWTMPLDSLFKPWANAHGQKLTHEEFIEFLDTNGDNIVEPSSKELLAMVEAIEIITSGSKLSFVSQHGDRAAISIKQDEAIGQKVEGGAIVTPVRELLVRVPVSQGGEPRNVRVNIHWSVRGGALAIRPTIHEYESLLRGEFERGEETIKAANLGSFFRGTVA